MDRQDTESEAFLRRFQPREPRPLPVIEQAPRRSLRWLIGSAAAVVLVLVSVLVFERSLHGTHAVLDSTDGSLYRVSAGPSSGLVRIGGKIRSDEPVRSEGRAILSLSDGSRVEMRSHSEMALQTANDGVLLQLNNGGIIVTAAKQGTGHLYVRTKDVTVSVIGTVFLVNAEEQGSHVAVIQGEIQAQQGKKSEKLHPGEQITTNPAMRTSSIPEELAWSQNAATYVALLKQAPQEPPRF